MSAADLEATRRVLEKAASDASARAAGALGAMVGESLSSEVHVSVLDAGQEPPRAPGDVATVFTVAGLPGCSFLVSFPSDTLASVREKMAPGASAEMAPDTMIAFEVANICTSHFLSAIGDLVEQHLLVSPPALSPPASDPTVEGPGFLIQADFRSPTGVAFGGAFRFRPGPDLVNALKRSPRVVPSRP